MGDVPGVRHRGDMMRLKGRVALVSGGSAWARRRPRRGVHRGGSARRHRRHPRGRGASAGGGAPASSARFVELDVTSESSWSSAVVTAMEWGGAVDVLVNNAGISVSRPLLQLRFDVFKQIAEVNYFGVFLGMKAVAPAMVRAGRGSIINISSVSGMVAVARHDRVQRLEVRGAGVDEGGCARTGAPRCTRQLRPSGRPEHSYVRRREPGRVLAVRRADRPDR